MKIGHLTRSFSEEALNNLDVSSPLPGKSFIPLNEKAKESSPIGVTDSLTPLSLQDTSVIKIQKTFRGFSERKAFLPMSSYLAYTKLCADSQKKMMEIAKDGKIDVYLPEEDNTIVLKSFPEANDRTSRENAIARFQSNHMVRGILKDIKASHLVVPRSLLCKDLLVEERLPILTSEFDCKELYSSRTKAFDGVVKEMVKVFSIINIPGLVRYNILRGNDLKVYDIVVKDIRYDNLPFYENKSKVQIGLVDLQRAGQAENEKIKLRLAHLAMIFPWHQFVIQKEADRLGLKYNEEDLSKSSKAGRAYLKTIDKPEEKIEDGLLSGRYCLPK